MRSSLIAIALLACTTKSPPPSPAEPSPASTPPIAVAPTPPTLDPPRATDEMPEPPNEEPKDEPCEPRMESWPAGHHDRYLFADEKTELHGYKNKAGAIVIKPRFVAAYPFGPGGIAAVIEPKGGPGFIDPSGTLIAKAHPMDNGPDFFQDKLARIIVNKKVGYIDSTGKIVIPAKYDTAMPFCDGKAGVELAGKALTIDKTGAPVKP